MPASTIDSSSIIDIVRAIPGDYQIIAPINKQSGIVLDKVENINDIAFGYISIEDRGSYELHQTDSKFDIDNLRFMNSLKSFTHRSKEMLYKIKKTNDTYEVSKPKLPNEKKAFFGAKPCDVNAMFIMDETFSNGINDEIYWKRRENIIIIAFNCTQAGKNCFCTTFDTGPELYSGYDLLITNLGNKYLVEIGSEIGNSMISKIETSDASSDDFILKEKLLNETATKMTKSFNKNTAKKVLKNGYNHPFWKEISQRCLSCANCINVCPTCYCYEIVDESTIDQTEFVRHRQWDACHNLDFAQIHGFNFRPNREQRVKQWVNHKLNWSYDQYGYFGCVGCGRCITWCPTKIDITEPVWQIGGKDVALKT